MDVSDSEVPRSKYASERRDLISPPSPSLSRPKPGKQERIRRRQEKTDLDLEALGKISDLDSYDPAFHIMAAKALREPEISLVKKAVEVLGSETVLGLLGKTKEIQENGGMMAADGRGRKTSGGVFFTLVKETASEEQRNEIFRRDKVMKKELLRAKRRNEIRDKTNHRETDESTLFKVSPPVLNLFPVEKR